MIPIEDLTDMTLTIEDTYGDEEDFTMLHSSLMILLIGPAYPILTSQSIHQAR